ncbi:MAG: hypothetical protein SGJ00_14190 [bacterium]|nr:hypothetical protein [bacterium]
MVFILYAWMSFAQNKILFLNPVQGKIIKAKEGDQLSVLYRGYLGQTEYFKNTLTEIKDSSFVLGIQFGLNPAAVGQTFQYKEIKYTDIVAFRRSSLGRTLLKSGLSLGAVITSILLLNRMYTQSEISDFGKIGISFGVGIGVNLLINLAIPDKPKHKVSEGWQINPIKE